jgi:hypothetical protein
MFLGAVLKLFQKITIFETEHFLERVVVLTQQGSLRCFNLRLFLDPGSGLRYGGHSMILKSAMFVITV